MHLSELKSLHVSQLLEMAAANEIEAANRMRKQEADFRPFKKIAPNAEKAFTARERLKCSPTVSGFSVHTRHVVPGRYGRHLRQSIANPPFQSAYGRQYRR